MKDQTARPTAETVRAACAQARRDARARSKAAARAAAWAREDNPAMAAAAEARQAAWAASEDGIAWAARVAAGATVTPYAARAAEAREAAWAADAAGDPAAVRWAIEAQAAAALAAAEAEGKSAACQAEAARAEAEAIAAAEGRPQDPDRLVVIDETAAEEGRRLEATAQRLSDLAVNDARFALAADAAWAAFDAWAWTPTAAEQQAAAERSILAGIEPAAWAIIDAGMAADQEAAARQARAAARFEQRLGNRESSSATKAPAVQHPIFSGHRWTTTPHDVTRKSNARFALSWA